MEALQKIRTWLGSEPSTMEDFDRAMNKVGEEVSSLKSKLDDLERELHTHSDAVAEEALGDESIDAVSARLEQKFTAETKLKAEAALYRARIQNREQRLAELRSARENARVREERRLRQQEGEKAVASLVEWVSHMKAAADAYRAAQGQLKQAQSHASAAHDETNFSPLTLHARSLGLHELYKLFGNGLTVQSAPSAVRQLDPAEYLSGVLVRQLRSGGNGNDGVSEEQHKKFDVETESSANQNGGGT